MNSVKTLYPSMAGNLGFGLAVAAFGGLLSLTFSADARREAGYAIATPQQSSAQPLAAVERRVFSLGLAGDIVPGGVGVQAVETDESTIIRDLRPDAAYAFSAMYGDRLPSIQTPEASGDIGDALSYYDGDLNRTISEASAVLRASHAVIETETAPPGGGIDRTKLANAEKESRCLAEALYFEARSESFDGQMAVGEVILNRVESRRYPSTICGVVYQNSDRINRCQFSYACDGEPEDITNQRAWRLAKSTADLLMGGERRGVSGRATHYHADYVAPDWAPEMHQTIKIGSHIFYRRWP